ncbi:hypothetical protein B0T16DRAFT_245725 [Cercophora newfieldiana]|uniref:Uncharacterized protein n=1 Tax=Cercophora newfieldiana TaxID=92897 RepID=A0AA40CIG1_9PEZI|nr:hypothetical protein B0T16DRAFT_245725 [Cercophora newfieldiana]
MEHVEGFDAVQERSLRSRKRANPEHSETEKWREVYRILFPHVTHEDTPSPFYDYGELALSSDKSHLSSWDRLNECEQYLLREVPPRLRRALSRELEADLSVVEESLRRKATACVKTLIADVFRELRDSAPGTPAGPSLGQEPQTQQGKQQGAGATQQQNAYSDFDFSFLDAFTVLGDEELRYDQGGLLDHLLLPPQEGAQRPEDQMGGDKKLSDSGYGSNSPDGSFQTSDDSRTLDEAEH